MTTKCRTLKKSLVTGFILLTQLSLSQQIKIMEETKLDLKLDNKILVENQLAKNPNNENHLLLSGMYVDVNTPEQYGNFAAISLNKGKSWENVTQFNIPEGADPWGLITSKGTAITTVLGLEYLFLYRSVDGGKNWNKTPLNLGRAHDHQTLIEDVTRNIIYLVSIQGNSIYVNYSLDDGATFEHVNKFKFSNLGSNTMTPVLLKDGTLMISFTTFNRKAIGGSRNGGKAERLHKNLSWIIPFRTDEGFKTPMFLSESCETGFPVLANDISGSKFDENLYYICSSQTDRSIVFHYSDTRGESWTEGLPLATYTNIKDSERNPFTGMPQITVNNKGYIGVVWQDRTQDPNGKCQSLFFTASIDGGKSFLKPVKVSSQLSCMENELNNWAGSRYKSGGDYTGFITDNNGDYIVIWPDSREGISQLYKAIIRVNP
jgi:hypothetical protein